MDEETTGSNNQTGQSVPSRMPRPAAENTVQDTQTATDGSPVAAPSRAQESKTSGGLVVLQWLVYAFWFWFVVSLTWLAGVVINFAVVKHATVIDWSGSLAYPMAAVIILMIIAFVADYFYAKHEPVNKSGAAYVIMLLHVVPLVLLAIGALVTIVFTFITMLLSSDPVQGIDGPLQVLLVSAVSAILLGVLVLRIFFGGRRVFYRKLAWVIFCLAAVGFMIAAIAGPAMQAASTRQDRLIEAALPSLTSDIREFVLNNNKLPGSLGDVSYSSSSSNADAVQKMIDQKLVAYKPNSIPVKEGNLFSPTDAIDRDKTLSPQVTPGAQVESSQRYYYQLCVNYVAEKKDRYDYSYSESRNAYTLGTGPGVASNYNNSYLGTIAEHPKGEVCYNLYADNSQAMPFISN